MMKTTTRPASRFGWEGTTLNYAVKANGATELVVPKECEDGLKVRITDMRRVGDGVEADVAVDVAGPLFY